MKVVLLKDVRGLGQKQDVKIVSDGYARNYLIPQKLAREIKEAETSALSLKKSADEEKWAKIAEAADKVADYLKADPLVLKIKVGDKGEVFGSITADKIQAEAEKLPALKKKPDGFFVEIDKPIKSLGDQTAIFNWGRGIKRQIPLRIEKE